ncbi:MAG: hypothetical protein ABIG89_03215 [Candidatus Woesearchaeota archaeon]
MSKKLIEMVCTGNQGRSPVAELVAKNYLRKIRADEYSAISSGTSVDAIKRGKPTAVFMMHVIDIAVSRDVYSLRELTEYQTAVKERDEDKLSLLYIKAQDFFGEEERRYRLEVLPELSIEGTLKEEQEQTIVRLNTIAIFSMAKSNNADVENIYLGSRYDPIIAVLSAYATQNPEASIPNAFGLPRENYVAAVEKIMEDVPMAIDRLLG